MTEIDPTSVGSITNETAAITYKLGELPLATRRSVRHLEGLGLVVAHLGELTGINPWEEPVEGSAEPPVVSPLAAAGNLEATIMVAKAVRRPRDEMAHMVLREMRKMADAVEDHGDEVAGYRRELRLEVAGRFRAGVNLLVANALDQPRDHTTTEDPAASAAVERQALNRLMYVLTPASKVKGRAKDRAHALERAYGINQSIPFVSENVTTPEGEIRSATRDRKAGVRIGMEEAARQLGVSVEDYERQRLAAKGSGDSGRQLRAAFRNEVRAARAAGKPAPTWEAFSAQAASKVGTE